MGPLTKADFLLIPPSYSFAKELSKETGQTLVMSETMEYSNLEKIAQKEGKLACIAPPIMYNKRTEVDPTQPMTFYQNCPTCRRW